MNGTSPFQLGMDLMNMKAAAQKRELQMMLTPLTMAIASQQQNSILLGVTANAHFVRSRSDPILDGIGIGIGMYRFPPVLR